MKKVVIGMSGGVDSAVAAYLLKKAGYDVIGLFMRNWDSMLNHDFEGQIKTASICSQEQDYNDAQATCNFLNIPLKRVDFIKEYWDLVFTDFLKELKQGRTPNPDLLCNKYIKFDLFIKAARKLGADYIATGHYAKLEDGFLKKAKDTTKDQTYFLAAVPQHQFQDVLFPLGDYSKKEVRQMATSIGIPVASKKDSTGICFIGERHFAKFLRNYFQPNPGPIIEVTSKAILGNHQGLMNYTIGQRKNIGVSGNAQRYYVCGKDMIQNILYVTKGNQSEFLKSDSCLLENVNYLTKHHYSKCTAKFRYRGLEHNVTLKYLKNGQILVNYPNQAHAVTPGQACVLYYHDLCLGSGFIKEVYLNGQKPWYFGDIFDK